MHLLKYAFSSRHIIKNNGLKYFLKQLQHDITQKILPKYFYRKQYLKWIRQNESEVFTPEMRGNEAECFRIQPKISIITPVWNVQGIWLCRMLESVIHQTYTNWELCIAEGNSENPEIKKILEDYSGNDSRIKIIYLQKNFGIGVNSNEALRLANGDYVILLDHDDELAPHAIHEIVKKINEDPNLDFIYSDKDKIDEHCKRKTPFFKPDWSPDLFLSINYVCHLTAIRKRIIDDIGGFRDSYDGAQDYDLFLRVFEKIEPKKIAHIPKILYHWRAHTGSTAGSLTAKPYAVQAGKKAISDALKRRGIDGKVLDGLFYGSYRVKYRILDNPKISIIIPSRDHVLTLKNCIESIQNKTSYENYEIVIIDNLSIEPETYSYYQILKKDPKIRILNYKKPFNYSAINNYGISLVESEIIVLLNNDTEVIAKDWLTAMLEHAQRSDVGAVGAKLLYPDGTVQHAGVILGIKDRAAHSHRGYPANERGYYGRLQLIGNFSAVTGACMMLRKEVFNEIGGFDETLSVALNDVDLCLKIRDKGYLIVYTPYSELYHFESLTRGYEDNPEKKARVKEEIARIQNKWGKIFNKADPYYNPNLTLEREDFSLKI
jgi:GT2 family glycosyltransferase